MWFGDFVCLTKSVVSVCDGFVVLVLVLALSGRPQKDSLFSLTLSALRLHTVISFHPLTMKLLCNTQHFFEMDFSASNACLDLE